MAKKKQSDIENNVSVIPALEGELLLYQSDDGLSRVEVRLDDETVWLSQNQMAELFQTTKQNISLHIQNVFEEGELPKEATVKESLTVQQEGNRSVQRRLEYYNLDVISVGYRVKSHRKTQFCIWATALREYLINRFTYATNLIRRNGRKHNLYPKLC